MIKRISELFRNFRVWLYQKQLVKGFNWVSRLYWVKGYDIRLIRVIVVENLLLKENPFDEGALRALELIQKLEDEGVI